MLKFNITYQNIIKNVIFKNIIGVQKLDTNKL